MKVGKIFQVGTEILLAGVLVGIVVLFLCSCDVGNSSNKNDSESVAVVNPSVSTCNTECRMNTETGEIVAIKSCSGEVPFAIEVATFDDCDSIFEE